MHETLLCARQNCQALATAVGKTDPASALLESRIARRVWGAENKQVKQQPSKLPAGVNKHSEENRI